MIIERLTRALVVAAAVVRRSVAKSPGTFAVGWRPPPSESDVASVAYDLRTNLDQLLLQARQRPVLDRLGRRQYPQKISEIVGECMNQGVAVRTGLSDSSRTRSRRMSDELES
jgi:hypothetical protein